MSEEAGLLAKFLLWALQDVSAMEAECLLTGKPFDEEAALAAIAERTGIPLDELKATLNSDRVSG